MKTRAPARSAIAVRSRSPSANRSPDEERLAQTAREQSRQDFAAEGQIELELGHPLRREGAGALAIVADIDGDGKAGWFARSPWTRRRPCR